MNKALKKLEEELAWMNADLNPEWACGGHDAARKAMAVYPPFLELEKQYGGPGEVPDYKIIDLAKTPEFREFLVKMFPDEEEPATSTPEAEAEAALAAYKALPIEAWDEVHSPIEGALAEALEKMLQARKA